MPYFKILGKFTNPEPGTERGWANIMFINGLADIIYSVGLALIVCLLLGGRYGGPVLGGVYTALLMAVVFTLGAAIGVARWIGAWRIVQRSRRI